MTAAVLVERDGAIATVVLDRPDKLNALSLAVVDRARRAHARALGRRRLCAASSCAAPGRRPSPPGNDIAEFPEVRANAAQGTAYGETMHATMRAIGECRHPIVAMIHGVCVGGGLEVALMCDLRICGARQPLRHPDQSPRPDDGLRRARRPAGGRRAGGGAGDPARRPHLRRAGSVRQGTGAARRRRRPGRSRSARRGASASPPAHRWSRAGTSSSSGACARRRSCRTRTGTKATPASTPRTSARGSPRSSPSASRGFQRRTSDHGAAHRTQGHRARAHHVGPDRAACCSPTWAPT